MKKIPKTVAELIELFEYIHNHRWSENPKRAKLVCRRISLRYYKSCHANDVEKIIKLTT